MSDSLPDEAPLREVHIYLPRDEHRVLLEGRQRSLTFVTHELGFPLRIIMWGADPLPKKPKFGSKALRDKEEDD